MSGATLSSGSKVEGPPHGEMKERLRETGSLGGVMGSLRVIELQLVSFILVFSASGLVPLLDLVFPFLISVYAFALGSMVFPKYRDTSTPEVFKGNRLFQLYVILGTTTGLFVPLGYVLGGFARGDQEAVRSATPHLFLLSFQILSENIIAGFGLFSLPVRALLPILYTARRLVSLSAWLRAAFLWKALPPNPRFQDVAWMWFGKGLAAANCVYFSVNLFAFLLPVFLPRAFESYFKDKEQMNQERVSKERMSHNTDEAKQAGPQKEKKSQ